MSSENHFDTDGFIKPFTIALEHHSQITGKQINIDKPSLLNVLQEIGHHLDSLHIDFSYQI